MGREGRSRGQGKLGDISITPRLGPGTMGVFPKFGVLLPLLAALGASSRQAWNLWDRPSIALIIQNFCLGTHDGLGVQSLGKCLISVQR